MMTLVVSLVFTFSAVAAGCGSSKPSIDVQADAGACPPLQCHAGVTSTCASTSLTGCAPKPASLASWWPGECDGSDTIGGRNATVQGGLVYTTGAVGHGFLFDGVDDVAAARSIGLYPTGSFSLEAWFSTTAPATSSQDRILVSLYDCGGACPSGEAASLYMLTLDASGTIWFTVRDVTSGGSGANGTQRVGSAAALADGGVHHLVGVRDVENARLQLFVDGAVSGDAALDPGIAGPLSPAADGEVNPLTIGAKTIAGSPGYEGFFKGMIDEVSYYGAALSAADVAALYTAGGIGKCP
jgi:hypothetical protein